MLISQFLWFWFFGCRDLYCSFYAFKKGIKRNNLLIRRKKKLRIYFLCSSAALPIFSAEWFFLQQCNEFSFLSSHFPEKINLFHLQMKNVKEWTCCFPTLMALALGWNLFLFFLLFFWLNLCPVDQWIDSAVLWCVVYLANPFYI